MEKILLFTGLLLFPINVTNSQEGYEYGPPPVQTQLTLKPKPRPTRPPRPQPLEAVGVGISKPQPSSSGHSHTDSSDPLAWLRESVPGEPGLDYPIYASPPSTVFSCVGREPGLYADIEAGCQAWHTCLDTRSWTHLCPNGTIFNQGIFSCVWWFEFDCEEAEQLYSLNDNLYKSEAGPSKNRGPDSGAGSRDQGFIGDVRRPTSQGGNKGQDIRGVSNGKFGGEKSNNGKPNIGRPYGKKVQPSNGRPRGQGVSKRPNVVDGLVLVLPAADDLPSYRPDTGYGAPGRRGGREEENFGGLFDY